MKIQNVIEKIKPYDSVQTFKLCYTFAQKYGIIYVGLKSVSFRI